MYTWSTLKKIVLPAAFLVILFTYSDVFSSQTPRTASRSVPTLNILSTAIPVDVSATAYAIFDAKTGEILSSKETEKVLPIASVTKLITAAALVKNIDLNNEGVITISDTATEGEAGQLVAGDKYQYRELLFPLLLESSNDAAAFFERKTDGEVIIFANDLAKNLGMESTRLTDASGLSDNNVSTVGDLMIFLTYLASEEPYVLDITRLSQYVGPQGGHLNNSPVMDSEYLGGKHGYTTAANRTLVALFEEDISNKKHIIGYVLLGSDNLARDTANLRNFVANSVTFE